MFLQQKIHVFLHYFSSKSSKTSHLEHKNSDKRAKFSDKWSAGGALCPPSPPIGFGPEITYFLVRLILSTHMYININKLNLKQWTDTKTRLSKQFNSII